MRYDLRARTTPTEGFGRDVESYSLVRCVEFDDNLCTIALRDAEAQGVTFRLMDSSMDKYPPFCSFSIAHTSHCT